MSDSNQFSAPEHMAGYLYQCRLALVESLRRISKGLDAVVALETLDDITFNYADGVTPAELLQAKHYSPQSTITDKSVQLWKSLRVWCTEIFENQVSAENANRFLITTSSAPQGSAAYCLRPETRDADTALKLLENATLPPRSQENKPCYEAFEKLSALQREHLIDTISVLDVSPRISDLRADLNELFRLSCPERCLDRFVAQIEGYWFGWVVDHLEKKRRVIFASELRRLVHELGSQYKSDDFLPLYEDIEDSLDFEEAMFAKQLRLINVGAKRIAKAARNYMRAYEHRSRWVEEEFLHLKDLNAYDDHLFDEWETRFEQILDELAGSTDETEALGRFIELYKWAESEAVFPLRSRNEPFVTRGSYHMMANAKRLGWHKSFGDVE